MNKQEIKQKYDYITRLLDDMRLKEALLGIQYLLDEKGDIELYDRLEQVHNSYFYMLQYMRQGIIDPEQKKLHQKLLKDTREIADQAYLIAMDEVSDSCYHQLHKNRHRITAGYNLKKCVQILESFQDELAIHQLMDNDIERLKKAMSIHESANRSLFISTWSNSAWTPEDRQTAQYLLESKQITSNDRSLFISALTLSLQECFDAQKLSWLLNAATSLPDDIQATQRALVGIALTLIKHPARTRLYPDLEKQFLLYDEEYRLGEKLNTVYLLLLRAKDTETTNQYFKKDVFPEVLKKTQQTMPKNFNMPEGNDEEDLNPEWRNAIIDSELEKKLQQMSEMQNEGFDINLITFEHLKHYPFFNSPENWLMPFDWNHSSILEYMGKKSGSNNNIMNSVLESGLLCNSDKYSLCLFCRQMPEHILKAMTTEFSASGLNEAEIANIKQKQACGQQPEVVCNLYIQDLYRFYKLSPQRKELFNPFKNEMNLHNIPVLRPLLCKLELLKPVSDYYIHAENWDAAGNVLSQIIDQFEQETDAEIYQKAGLCMQKKRWYYEAIYFYEKADLLKPDQLWTIRHLATCHRMAENYQQALDYYKKTEAIQPENKQVLFFIGTCLAETKQYHEAMNYFFKLDFMEENNIKAWRAIAWYSFVSGKLEQAEKYYQKILNSQPTSNDYMNAAYVAWAMDDMPKVYQRFCECPLFQEDKVEFQKAFDKDKYYLLAKGISDEQIALVMDMIL